MKTVGTKNVDGIILFWRNQDYMSNWYPSTFVMNGHLFANSEQAFIYLKVKQFNDKARIARVLTQPDPYKVKKIGRQPIDGYDEKIWKENRFDAMRQANYAKYSQSPQLTAKLIETDGYSLAEASPTDDIWGIGLSEDDPRAWKKETWQGQDLLGLVLEDVRAALIVEKNFVI